MIDNMHIGIQRRAQEFFWGGWLVEIFFKQKICFKTS